MCVCINVVVGSTLSLCVHLFSHCWLDVRGGQTGKMTDCSVVAGVAGPSLCLQLSSNQLPRVNTATLRDRPRLTTVGLPCLLCNLLLW